MKKVEIKILFYIVRNFVPKKLMYFVYLQIISHVTTGKYSDTDVTKLSCMDAIKRFSDDFEI